MSAPKRPGWGSADAGGHSRWRSEAERLEEEVRIAEWQAAEAERERRARERLAELMATADPKARRRREIVEAYNAVRDEARLKPTVENVAARLDMSESGLKRERADLGMTGWPPTLDPI